MDGQRFRKRLEAMSLLNCKMGGDDPIFETLGDKMSSVVTLVRYHLEDASLLSMCKMTLGYSGYLEYFKSRMAAAASGKGRDGWLEKTPLHFYKLDALVDSFPDACFICVIRDPLATLASIRHRSMNYDKRFFGGQYDISYGIKLWNDSVRHITCHLHRANVLLVKYEDFAHEHEQELSKVSAMLGRSIVKPRAEPMRIVERKEEWKSGLSTELSIRQSKAEQVFTREEMDEIKRMTSNSFYK